MTRTDANGPNGPCSILRADEGRGHEPSGTRRLRGDQFDIEFVRIRAGETVERAGGSAAGEEVAAVLEGTLRVSSAGESYRLSPGEGLIIPPGEGSSWHALDGGGLLYRVIVRVRPSTVAGAGVDS